VSRSTTVAAQKEGKRRMVVSGMVHTGVEVHRINLKMSGLVE